MLSSWWSSKEFSQAVGISLQKATQALQNAYLHRTPWRGRTRLYRGRHVYIVLSDSVPKEEIVDFCLYPTPEMPELKHIEGKRLPTVCGFLKLFL